MGGGNKETNFKVAPCKEEEKKKKRKLCFPYVP